MSTWHNTMVQNKQREEEVEWMLTQENDQSHSQGRLT